MSLGFYVFSIIVSYLLFRYLLILVGEEEAEDAPVMLIILLIFLPVFNLIFSILFLLPQLYEKKLPNRIKKSIGKINYKQIFRIK